MNPQSLLRRCHHCAVQSMASYRVAASAAHTCTTTQLSDRRRAHPARRGAPSSPSGGRSVSTAAASSAARFRGARRQRRASFLSRPAAPTPDALPPPSAMPRASRRFGTRLTVAHTNDDEPENEVLDGYVWSCLKRPEEASGASAEEEEEEEQSEYTQSDNTGFNVSFLGTGGGGTPSQHRVGSACALRLGGRAFLFDAAEGTQRQVALSRVRDLDFARIFVTHLHGDHIFGLPGLLLKMQHSAKSSVLDEGRNSLSKRPVVQIYGPVGIYNYLAMTMALSCVRANSLTIVVHELTGGKEEGGPQQWSQRRRSSEQRGDARQQQQQQQRERSIFHSFYPEVRSPGLVRKRLPRNADGTWTIEEPGEITERMIEESMNAGEDGGRHSLPNDLHGNNRSFRIRAGEVDHLPGVQTFGYVVEELEPPRRIDAERATELGVKPGRKYKRLKNGYPVLSDDGTREVRPEEVLFDRIEPRKFALIGDNCSIPPEMAGLCRDADVLVHEAGFLEQGEWEAMHKGHATPEMAGRFAREVNAKVLLLNHISATHNAPYAIKRMVRKAERANGGVSQVKASYDFMELAVPRGGFDFRSEQEEVGISGDVRSEEKQESSSSSSDDRSEEKQEGRSSDNRWFRWFA